MADRSALNKLVEEALAALVPDPSVERLKTKKGVGALTAREIEVICLAAEDKTDQAIADILFVSVRTVESHMSHIYRKLGVYSRTGAVVRALIEEWCN